MGILNSYRHFLLPALAPAVYNLCIIGGAALLAPSIGVYGLAVGVVAGEFVAGILWMIINAILRMAGMNYTTFNVRIG